MGRTISRIPALQGVSCRHGLALGRFRPRDRSRKRSLLGWVLGSLLSMGLGSPAHANIAVPLGAFPLVTMTGVVPTSSSCSRYTYDQNGNRLSRSASGLPTDTPTWGSSVFGCSTWG
jgi:hypothetical protein